MDDERDTQGRIPGRFTPDTLPGAGPAYGPNQPYDPATPEPQTEQSPLGGEIPEDKVISDIKDRLARHSASDADRIEVSFAQGVIILSGTVPDQAAREEAERLAASTPGVSGVDNDIQVAPDSRREAL